MINKEIYKDLAEEVTERYKEESCGNCQNCKQYFTGDNYPEFGCGIQKDFKYDHIGYPSFEEKCELWKKDTRKSWMK